MRIRITERYKRSARKHNITTKAARTVSRFIENAQHPGLHFEQLSGWDDTYSIRVNRQYRILLVRETDEAGEIFAVVDIDTHQIYRR